MQEFVVILQGHITVCHTCGATWNMRTMPDPVLVGKEIFAHITEEHANGKPFDILTEDEANPPITDNPPFSNQDKVNLIVDPENRHNHRSVAFAKCSIHQDRRWSGNCEFCLANGIGQLADAMDRVAAAVDALGEELAKLAARVADLESELEVEDQHG